MTFSSPFLSSTSPTSVPPARFISLTHLLPPHPFPPTMNTYSTSSDHRYPDSLANTAIPQATSFWPPGGPDGSQSAVTRNSDDRYGPPPRLRPNQLPTSYASTPAFPITQRDSYPAQTQSDCSGQYPYPPQQYRPVVNYATGPFDLAEYPVSNDVLSCALPSIHRVFIRSFLVAATIPTGSMRPRCHRIASTISPQILTTFITSPTTTWGTFLLTATTVRRLMANISKAYYQILQVIHVVMALLTNSPPLPNTQSSRFLPPALLSLGTLS